ncbi:MAG: glycoside hydrolase family 130 protein [Turicibacter sp.]
MKVQMIRNECNPLITPANVLPSRNDFKVDCAFNAGVTKFNDEVILLVRVAESVINEDEFSIKIPLLEETKTGYELVVKEFDRRENTDIYDYSDSRSIWERDKHNNRKIKYLTSLSHLRIARSHDGVNFTVEDAPFIFPDGKYETWGIEDARITQLDGVFYINYTAVSELGAATALAKTTDFMTYERMGVIFPPENKDVSIFSEKINGLYYAYHRPVPKAIGNPDMWMATSPDLIHWGNHQHLLSVAGEDSWENGRIGGGAPSFKTDKGWIHIYHAADKNDRYCLGAFITPLDNPGEIIAKTVMPILEPTADYELVGFFGNVVFTCGLIVDGQNVNVYYGAADEVMAVATITIDELHKALGV